VLDQNTILIVPKGRQGLTELEKEYHFPLATSIVPAILSDQRDFFLSFLLIFIKYESNGWCTITTLGINFRKGLRLGMKTGREIPVPSRFEYYFFPIVFELFRNRLETVRK
jgi:hypothetical protein